MPGRAPRTGKSRAPRPARRPAWPAKPSTRRVSARVSATDSHGSSVTSSPHGQIRRVVRGGSGSPRRSRARARPVWKREQQLGMDGDPARARRAASSLPVGRLIGTARPSSTWRCRVPRPEQRELGHQPQVTDPGVRVEPRGARGVDVPVVDQVEAAGRCRAPTNPNRPSDAVTSAVRPVCRRPARDLAGRRRAARSDRRRS